MVNIGTARKLLWKASPTLMATCVMTIGFAACLVGLLVDGRTIGGAPAWLKPAKFTISSAIFTATVAWFLSYVSVWRTLVRVTAWTISSVLVLEVAIITLQAGRGTTSHFNARTPLDTALWTAMGVAIGLLWIASVAVLAALFKQTFDNPAWGWWLRLGMLTSVIGSAAGGLMVRPTPSQVQVLRAGERPASIGAHTVGAEDGGPGLPGVGWSSSHGDLRIPHFFGLHGAQIIPFIGWFAMRGRRQPDSRRLTRLAFIVTASYLSLTGILTWQALRGQSIIEPDSTTLLAFAIWLAATALLTVPRAANRHSSPVLQMSLRDN